MELFCRSESCVFCTSRTVKVRQPRHPQRVTAGAGQLAYSPLGCRSVEGHVHIIPFVHGFAVVASASSKDSVGKREPTEAQAGEWLLGQGDARTLLLRKSQEESLCHDWGDSAVQNADSSGCQLLQSQVGTPLEKYLDRGDSSVAAPKALSISGSNA